MSASSAHCESNKRRRAEVNHSSPTSAVLSIVQQIHHLLSGSDAELPADELLRIEETLQQGISNAVKAREMKDSGLWEVVELDNAESSDDMRFFQILLNDSSVPENVRTILQRAQKQVEFARLLLETDGVGHLEVTDNDDDRAEVYRMWTSDKSHHYHLWSHQFANKVWTNDTVRDYVWQRHVKHIPDEFTFLDGLLKDAFFRELRGDGCGMGVSGIVKPRRAVLHIETNNEVGYDQIRKVEHGSICLKVERCDTYMEKYEWTVAAVQVS